MDQEEARKGLREGGGPGPIRKRKDEGKEKERQGKDEGKDQDQVRKG